MAVILKLLPIPFFDKKSFEKIVHKKAILTKKKDYYMFLHDLKIDLLK